MKESFIIMPEELFESIREKLDQLLSLQQNKNDIKGEFITEKEAMELFKRRSTWFWQMRKIGALPYSKIGKAIFYSLKDIQALLDNTKVNANSDRTKE